MCGHVGVAGDLISKEETLMKKLLMFDYFRGPDSTGLAAIRSDGSVKIAKAAASPPELFYDTRFREALNGNQSRAFIGHNRLATRGVVNPFNAHPFQFNHITGAHNGTLETSCKWKCEDLAGEKFDVDSQALFAAIAAVGVDNVIPHLKSCDTASNSSAWALVWHDKNDGTINFLRNQHRPLWYGFEKGFKRLMWASTWEILDNAVRMDPCTYDMYVEDETRFKYWPFEADVHYSIELAELKKGSTERPKFTAKPLKGKEPVAASGTTGNADPFGFRRRHTSTGNGSTTNSPGKSQSGTSTKAKKQSNAPVQFLHLLGDIGAPYAGWIKEDRFNEMAKYGCSWCGTSVDYGEAGVTIYDRDDMVLCPGCSGHVKEDAEPPTHIFVRGSNLDAML
jgi:DNA-directed RNA polymerase subunit RPC12/RpoP